MAAVAVPSELLEVPQQTLQGYVRQCARRVLDDYVARLQSLPISTKINDTVALQRAAGETLDSVFGKQTALSTRRSSLASGDAPYKLVFAHDCKNVSCAKASCTICANSQHRRCKQDCHFQSKYIKNDLLKARCDASVRLQLIDRKTGEPAYANARLKVTVLDSSDLAKKIHNGMDPDAALEAAVRVYTNGKPEPQPLLVCTTAEYDEHKSVVLELENGMALLPDVRVCESSEALRGRGAEFRLLVESEGVHLGGNEWVPVKHVLSEPFQVLSSRSKPNCKPEIPHIDDPVKNVEAIGDATVPKLERLVALGQEMGIDLSQVPIVSVTKVGEFRELARLAATDKNLQDKLRKVLALTKDQWRVAHEHSNKAVISDHRMRVWYPHAGDASKGVLFECIQGNVLLNKPVGMVLPDGVCLESQMHTDPAKRMAIKAEIEELLPRAVADWYMDGHGSWSVFVMPGSEGPAYPMDMQQQQQQQQQQQYVQQEQPGPSPFFAMPPPSPSMGGHSSKMMRTTPEPVGFDNLQYGTTNNVHPLLQGFAPTQPEQQAWQTMAAGMPPQALGMPPTLPPAPHSLAPSVFENPGEQFQAMLAEILTQQAPGRDNDLKRKPSRGLSELFTSMSLQQMTGGDSNLQSIPTTNMMELLKNMISERPGGNNMTLLETMSQQFDAATLSDMDPAARALLEQLVGAESGLSTLSGSSGAPSVGAAASGKGSNPSKGTPPPPGA